MVLITSKFLQKSSRFDTMKNQVIFIRVCFSYCFTIFMFSPTGCVHDTDKIEVVLVCDHNASFLSASHMESTNFYSESRNAAENKDRWCDKHTKSHTHTPKHRGLHSNLVWMNIVFVWSSPYVSFISFIRNVIVPMAILMIEVWMHRMI